MSDQLTPHFSLSELTHSDMAVAHGIDNTPTPEAVEALHLTADMLEGVRTHLCDTAGRDIPVSVSSGYRGPELNHLVGGVPVSDHLTGHAADITAPEFGAPFEVAQCLLPHLDGLGIGQMILERLHGKHWVHLSTKRPGKPLNRVITITDAGTLVGLREVA